MSVFTEVKAAGEHPLDESSLRPLRS